MSQPTCYPKSTLKQYVAGWTDAEESSVIEAHLADCAICEQTLSELEGQPDTLLEFLQSRESAKSDLTESEHDPVVAYALSRAKQLSAGHDELDEYPGNPSTPPTALGPYDLLKPIGQGSMGRVYLARHRQLGKLVAVKIFASRAFRSDEYARRFEREVRAAGALQHPAIINATDAGATEVDQGHAVHYLVMEYIEGLDLSRIARAVGQLPIAEACAIGRAMALGLDHAHAAGIVHRDIKPSNVMLSHDGQVKLLDFGLAQTTMWDEASAELTTVGQLMGTIDYMAPEQAERAEAVDYRADLYALGATLFRLLCGRAPLAASPNLSPLARLKLLATSTPPALRTLRPDAPPELERLIHQLLSRSPDDRPPSAAHVAEQLSQLSHQANLTELLRTAQLTNSVTKTDDGLAPGGMQPLVHSQRSQPPGNRVARWLMGAMAGAIGLAAIVLITLETQKGQVVIESLDANVTVQISKSGHVQQQLKVVPGANSTRIAAGDYDVTLATSSDQFELDHNTLHIKRGETVIARVRQVAATTNANDLNATDPNVADLNAPSVRRADSETGSGTKIVDSSEKVYEGKTLASWRKQLEQERSLEAINKALAAVHALANLEERIAIVQDFLVNFPPNLRNHQRELLETTYQILGDKRAYVQSLATALRTVDAITGKGLLADLGVDVLIRSSRSSRADLELMEPILHWAIDELHTDSHPGSTDEAHRELQKAAANTIIILRLQKSSPGATEREQELVNVLTSAKGLGDEYWLSIVPNLRTDPPTLLSDKLMMAVEERATACFLLKNSDIRLVITSARLLTLLNGKAYDRAEMQPLKKRSEIVAMIGQQLQRFIEQPKTIFQQVDFDEHWSAVGLVPRVLISPRLAPTNLVLGISHANKTFPCLDLLELATVLKHGNELENELNHLFDIVKPPAFAFAAQLVGDKSSQRYTLSWPDLRYSSNGGFAPRSPSRVLDTRLAFTPTANEVLAAFLFSTIEEMLPYEKQMAIRKELPAAIKQTYIDLVLKKLDSNQDGKYDSTEVPASESSNKDGDGFTPREELQREIERMYEAIDSARRNR